MDNKNYELLKEVESFLLLLSYLNPGTILEHSICYLASHYQAELEVLLHSIKDQI